MQRTPKHALAAKPNLAYDFEPNSHTVGDLAFGRPFNCLEEGALHPWVENTLIMLKASAHMRAIRRMPTYMAPFLRLFLPRDLIARFYAHLKLSKDRANERMSQGDTGRPDFSMPFSNSCKYHG